MEELAEERAPRPGFLTVLSVLSFINIGIDLLMWLVGIIAGPSSDEVMLEQRVQMKKLLGNLREEGADGAAGLFDQLQGMLEQTNEHFYLAQGVNFVMLAVGLIGVIFMFKGFRKGFHLYIVYNLLRVGGVFIYVSAANIPVAVTIFSVLFCGLFVFMYSRNLKWITK